MFDRERPEAPAGAFAAGGETAGRGPEAALAGGAGREVETGFTGPTVAGFMAAGIAGFAAAPAGRPAGFAAAAAGAGGLAAPGAVAGRGAGAFAAGDEAGVFVAPLADTPGRFGEGLPDGTGGVAMTC